MSEYRKAIVAAITAALGPILAYLLIAGDWSWRAFAASVIAGLIGGGTTYLVPNAPSPVYRAALARGQREAGLTDGPA